MRSSPFEGTNQGMKLLSLYSVYAWPHTCTTKPGFHKANFIHDNDQFLVKAKQLPGRMTAQQDHGIFCVVVVELAAGNANQA